MSDVPAIVETVVRYECPKCGNSCQCGVPYTARTERATKYAEQNPTASVRQIAKETGVSIGTAYQAKAGVQTEHVTTGQDGKQYPARKPKSHKPLPLPPDDGIALKFDSYIAAAIELLRLMPGEQRVDRRDDAIERLQGEGW
jgi:hypothetical protein